MTRQTLWLTTSFISLFSACFAPHVYAFTCQAQGTTLSSSGSVRVNVALAPQVQSGQNLVIDLSNSIQCKNDAPQQYDDPIRIAVSSAYSGSLNGFTGSINYYGVSYPFPTTTATAYVNNKNATYTPWKAILYLTPLSGASVSGVAIKTGELFAKVVLEKGPNASQSITWNLYASNDVTVPTGTCDVSARSVTVQLPNYSQDSTGSTDIPLTVHCSQTRSLNYIISGSTTDSGATIFSNVSTSSPATGIGVKIRNNGSVLAANQTILLGNVGTTPVSLGLSAEYARTTGQVTAGNVQSLVNVTFSYQ